MGRGVRKVRKLGAYQRHGGLNTGPPRRRRVTAEQHGVETQKRAYETRLWEAEEARIQAAKEKFLREHRRTV